MWRASYGADEFSPIRGNSSFNDALNDEKDSDYLSLWQEPYDAIGKNLNSEVEEKNSSIPLCKDESPSINKVSDILQPTVNTRKGNKKVSSSKDLSRLSNVTTRSRSSYKSEKKLGAIQESRSTHHGTVSKTRKKDSETVRSEMDSNEVLTSNKIKQNSASSVTVSDYSNNELPPSKNKQNKELPPMKIKKNKNSASCLAPTNSCKELLSSKITLNKDSLVSLVEEQPEKNPTFNVHSGSISDLNYLGLSDEPCKVLSRSNAVLKKSKKLEKDTIKKYMQIEKPNEMNLDKENNQKSENGNAESSSSVLKPEQIQANIIEKLVKDAVSFEFDGIRQMLYLHQLQLLRHMDHNVCCSELQRAFEDLIEENRRLKNLLAQQKT
ncbi:uncharacterized protein [Parasteatoda tepidariorum]|uniref:uncharacterized protein isoform X1 n=1 Tax=Parasteatoda tepidariorum TaxID=114398 RepID=UPI001C724DCA|nr:uncharacterized protein LOC107442962 [Parasteatoda tepidariorum]